MWRQIARYALFGLLAVSLTGFAGEVTFTKPPAAVKAGAGAKITFAVSKKTDVEVAVLDAKGKVVRHLAAGVLGGKHPPPAPLKAGLSQTIEWDGKDDFGQPAPGGPFRIRVRAGTGVTFGRIFGSSPYTGVLTSRGPSDSVAVGPDGSLYVKLASLVPALHAAVPWQLRKFDREGKYVKTLLPYAPSTDPSKTPGFRLVNDGTPYLTPRHSTPLDVVLYRFGDNIYKRLVNGSVVFINPNKLVFFKVDGSNALKTIPIKGVKWRRLAVQVAFSPDGRYAYYSNAANIPYDPKKPSDLDAKFPQGRIYRQDLTRPGAVPERFYDLKLPDWNKKHYWLPNAWNKKSAAGGIDVDAKGHIFVCDLVNQEVVELSPEGKKLGASKVPWPDKVLAAGKSGTLYVVSCKVSKGFRPPATLLKISGRGAQAKVTAKLPLGRDLGQSIALNETGKAPLLWIGGHSQLVRVEDKGASFAKGPSILNRDRNVISFVTFGDVDTEAERVYIANGMGPVWRYDGRTGQGGRLPIKACDIAIGPRGRIYTWGTTGSYAGPIARYTREVKPAPLAATGKHTYAKVYGRYGRGNNAPGIAVDWQGRVYTVCGFNNCILVVYGPDGQLVPYERQVNAPKWIGRKGQKIPAFLSYVLDQGGSVRVDPAGNVYVLEIGFPKGFTPPQGFAKDPAYTRCAGTIYKFPPTGGTFKKGKHGWEAVGAVGQYAACGPISGSWSSTISVCHCMRPRFDVDAYGRLYIPNGITYKVSMRDNADNEIVRFGAYGNYDAQGPKSKEPKPAIPLGWPIFAGASERYIYVGDGLNHRVVRVDFMHAAEQTCAVK